MRLVLILFMGISLLACADVSEQKPAVATSREYHLIKFTGMDTIPDTPITLRIEDQTFSGQGPVNRYFGKIIDNRITSPIGSTMMAGPDFLMQYEHKYFTALDSAFVSGIGGDTLKLINANDVEMVFVLTRE